MGRKSALSITKAMLSLPIKWIELDKSIIIKMTDIFEKTTLDPRDAAHVASMKEVGLSSILSEDADFDTVDEIERVPVAQYLKRTH